MIRLSLTCNAMSLQMRLLLYETEIPKWKPTCVYDHISLVDSFPLASHMPLAGYPFVCFDSEPPSAQN